MTNRQSNKARKTTAYDSLGVNEQVRANLPRLEKFLARPENSEGMEHFLSATSRAQKLCEDLSLCADYLKWPEDIALSEDDSRRKVTGPHPAFHLELKTLYDAVDELQAKLDKISEAALDITNPRRA